MTPRTSRIVFAVLLLCVSFISSQAQVPVTLFTGGQFVSYLQNGEPNAFGCVFFYNSGTSNPLDTYVDYTGNIKNANPVVLTAGGTANVWMISGDLYSVTVKTSGGVNCVSGSTVYTASGINNSLLNQSNTWQLPQIFNDPISILASDLQIVFGSPSGTQTTLDIPPTSANVILHGPPLMATDTLLSQNATQTVTNKNLTTGTQVNGCGMTNDPATYVCIANAAPTGTVINSLATVINTPSQVTLPPALATSGVIGICVSACGNTGTATIQQSGTAVCGFDNATTAGDYVQIAANGYQCHDSGIAFSALPPSTQIIGTVFSTNSGPGGYLININLSPHNAATETNITVAALTGGGSVCASGIQCAITILTLPHTLIRLIANVTQAPTGCSTNANFGFIDLTSSTVLSFLTSTSGTGVLDSGAIAVAMTAGHTFGLGVTFTGLGCSQFPLASLTAVYR